MAYDAVVAVWDAVVSAAETESVQASVASAAVSAGAAAAMAPKTPGVKPPTAMPDQQSVDAARRRATIEQMSQRGRASTILTDPSGDNTLG